MLVEPLVSYDLTDGVATVTRDDGKVNALGLDMLTAVGHALDRASADGAVVVLAGRSGIFSGGFDLTVLRAGGPDAARMLEGGFELALRLLTHPDPVVIACNGHAIAMGSFLLLSGDDRIGAEGPYRLVANEVAIGLTMPWAAIEICRQRLAPSHFLRAVNLSETYSPSGALAAGFLDRVVDEADLLPAALAAAGGLEPWTAPPTGSPSSARKSRRSPRSPRGWLAIARPSAGSREPTPRPVRRGPGAHRPVGIPATCRGGGGGSGPFVRIVRTSRRDRQLLPGWLRPRPVAGECARGLKGSGRSRQGAQSRP
jgi:enoyl-CoA hydratase